MSWTDERVEMLKKLWTEGLTASQIASKLGGVSRNAVIGKVHRLKLEPRGKSTKSSGPKVRKPSLSSGRSSGGSYGRSRGGGSVSAGARSMGTRTHTVGATVMKTDVNAEAFQEFDVRPIEDIVIPIAKRLTLVELSEQTCKWPHGDPLSGEFYFCGHDVEEGSPYCKYHSKLAYQQPQDRKRTRR